MKSILILMALASCTANAGALEDAINQKARGATYCSVMAAGELTIACDGKDIFQGSERFSLGMKLMLEAGLKPISCNYARGDKDVSDVTFCAMSR